MKKACLFLTALLCLVINFTSCTPEALTSKAETPFATGDEIDDPVDPDEDND